MGINSPFENEHDFDSMLSISQVVDKIIHKTKFKLDENGTEAAAATVVSMARSCGPNQMEINRISLEFNRPFAFMIRHVETKEILFIGKINNLK